MDTKWTCTFRSTCFTTITSISNCWARKRSHWPWRSTHRGWPGGPCSGHSYRCGGTCWAGKPGTFSPWWPSWTDIEWTGGEFWGWGGGRTSKRMNNPSCQRDAGWAPGGLRTATPVEVCRLEASLRRALCTDVNPCRFQSQTALSVCPGQPGPPSQWVRAKSVGHRMTDMYMMPKSKAEEMNYWEKSSNKTETERIIQKQLMLMIFSALAIMVSCREKERERERDQTISIYYTFYTVYNIYYTQHNL